MDAEPIVDQPAGRRNYLHPRYVPTRLLAVAAALIPVAALAGLVLAIVMMVYQHQVLAALWMFIGTTFMACCGYAFTVFVWHIVRAQPPRKMPFNIPLLAAFERALMLLFVQVFALVWCSLLVGMTSLGIRDIIQKG